MSGGVARRGQRQFSMTPRGLPAGRMGLVSPSGIGGASPRHTLTSPAMAGQGRQVSIPVILIPDCGMFFLPENCGQLLLITLTSSFLPQVMSAQVYNCAFG